MATPKARTRLTLDLDPGERKRLEALAAENERSLSQECRLAIRQYLEKLSRRSR